MSNSNEAATGSALALCADLMFASKIRGAATAAGANVRLARTADELADGARDNPRVILLDLDARFDIPALIAKLKSDPATREVPLIAFVSHVNEDKIAAARAAGADRVVARSAFVRMLPDLFP